LKQPRTVIVGRSKPLLNYVTACITIFNEGHDRLILRARGEAINQAVEVMQLLKSRFLGNLYTSNISIDSETVTTKEGKQLNLPVLEITLSKSNQKL